MCAERPFWSRGNFLRYLGCATVFVAMASAPIFGYAATLVSAETQPLVIQASSKAPQTVTVSLSPGRWVIDSYEFLASARLTVPSPKDPQKTLSLESVNGGAGHITWMVETEKAQVFDLDIEFLAIQSPKGTLTISVRDQASLPNSALQALANEQAVNSLATQLTDENKRKALVLIQNAASSWHKTNRPDREAHALRIASSLYNSLGNVIQAEQALQNAVKLAADNQLSLEHGLALSALGLIEINSNKEEAAAGHLKTAERLLQSAYFEASVNPATSNLCYLAMQFRRLDEAERCFLRLLPLAKKSGDLLTLRIIQNNLGGTYAKRDQPIEAIRFLTDAMITAEALGDDEKRAKTLNNLGIQYRRISRFQKALNAYQTALEIHQRSGNQAQEARTLGNIGVAYGSLGEPHTAVSYLRRAHDLREPQKNRLLVLAKTNLAGALAFAQDYEQAFIFYDDALTLAQTLNAPNAFILRIEIDRAIAQIDAGNTALGLSLLNEVLAKNQREAGDQETIAKALHYQGIALASQNRLTLAANALNQALTMRENLSHSLGIAETTAALGWLHWQNDNTIAAKQSAMKAIEQIETLRTDIANSDLRASYQSALADAYELAVYTVMSEDSEASVTEGLSLAERYRAQTLVDVLVRNNVDLATNIPDKLKNERQALRAKIAIAEDKRLRGLPSENTSEFVTALNVLDDELIALNPQFKATSRKQNLTTQALQNLLGEEDIALQYFLGREDSFVWAITRTSIDAFRLPSGPGIGDMTRRLHNALSRRENYRSLALSLGNALLAPLDDRLKDYTNLVIVADGPLHYLPFEVLTTSDPSAPDLEQKTIAYLPSLTTLQLMRDGHANSSRESLIAVFADPVFTRDDERLSTLNMAPNVTGDNEPMFTLNRLRMSAQEADAIKSLAGERPLFIRMGTDATVSALGNEAVTRAQIIHIASHGFVNDNAAARTGLALSMVDVSGNPITGFVSMRDIYELDLSAELVVLSACDTALGRDLAGEGLLGLTRGFMFAGAERVIASLWQVEDRATATLMEYFYEGILTDKLSPAVALARAKQRLRQSRRWRHPYYWSGFVLQGDWQKLNDG